MINQNFFKRVKPLAISRIRRIGLVMLVFTFTLWGCLPVRAKPLEPVPTLTPQITVATETIDATHISMPKAILGKWKLDHRRFTNSILEFRPDNILVISALTNNQVYATMHYRFIQDYEIEITGAPEYESRATLKFQNGELCATFIFEGNVFGEIFPCMIRIQ